jgi:hypothetical protein
VSDRCGGGVRPGGLARGEAGLASRGQAAQCRLDEQQLAVLDVALEAGPLAAGWEDQRWTPARVRDLVARKFRVQYTVFEDDPAAEGSRRASKRGQASFFHTF